MIFSGRDKMRMNKKGLVGKIIIMVLAVTGGYFLLKYFGAI